MDKMDDAAKAVVCVLLGFFVLLFSVLVYDGYNKSECRKQAISQNYLASDIQAMCK